MRYAVAELWLWQRVIHAPKGLYHYVRLSVIAFLYPVAVPAIPAVVGPSEHSGSTQNRRRYKWIPPHRVGVDMRL
jgi:hypothetical protein